MESSLDRKPRFKKRVDIRGGLNVARCWLYFKGVNAASVPKRAATYRNVIEAGRASFVIPGRRRSARARTT